MSFDPLSSFLTAAIFWDGYGLKIIPILPGTKQAAVKWEPWLEGLDAEKIYKYWSAHPDHEVATLIGKDLIVFDADTPESLAALRELEDRFGMKPRLAIKTAKGEHHYFRLAPGVVVKTENHCSEKHPERLDIKCGSGYMILTPSTGKSIIVNDIDHIDDLSEASQEFVYAALLHNRKNITEPATMESSRPYIQGKKGNTPLKKIQALLRFIDADAGYDDWYRVGMVIYHETAGSDEGQALFDSWSSAGKKYPGTKKIEAKWKSFRDVPTPVTIGTLIMMAKKAGADVAAIMNDGAFEVCETEEVSPAHIEPQKIPEISNPLAKFYIRDIDQLERIAMDQVPIFGNVALLGQATVIYAKQNTGKTLILLHLIIEAIKAGKFHPAKLIYINMDDDSNGLAVKARLAEEYGFRMVADGHNGFQAKEFRSAMEKMIATNTAHGFIIILDTLKKFVNTMSKEKSSDFAKVVRQFVLKGGTVVALSHANKRPDLEGKTVYSGTTDIIDDFDCGYTITTVCEDLGSKRKIVEFDNIKKRGNVTIKTSYSYALESGISYNELLLSVQEVNSNQLESVKKDVEILSDTNVIIAIESCIRDGVNTKMELAAHAAERAKISRRTAIKIIEKYSGDDPALHWWTFEVGERGAKVFRLLTRPEVQPPDPAMPTP